MNKKHVILRGAFILTLAGFISRIIGFFYRIFLSHTIGAEGMGIYQLVFPVYTMVMSLTASGIQTVISRNVSAKMALNDKRGARDTLISGLLLSFSLSLCAFFILHRNAAFIANHLLSEPRCEDLVRLLAYSVPFSSIHTCINGYYLGLRRSKIPAITQLLEQAARVSVSYLVYVIMIEKGIPVTPILAIAGLVCEEIVSGLFCLTAVLFHFKPSFGKNLHKQSLRYMENSLPSLHHMKSIFTLSFPLTVNRVLINLLQSVEAVCIPMRLQLFGLTNSEALSIYGVLTGMALPLVLFPSAITSSISMMLLPTVSEAQAADNKKQITYTIENTIRYCLLLGILCTGVFLVYGKDMGYLLFHNENVGQFILVLAWICPFLYLGTTLSSILNGLGKTTTSFIHNTAALIIRILFVWFAIPRFGITGYLWGVLASQLCIAALALYHLRKNIYFHFNSINWILKPVLALLISTGITFFVKYIIVKFNWNLNPFVEIIILCILLCSVYLGMMLQKPRE